MLIGSLRPIMNLGRPWLINVAICYALISPLTGIVPPVLAQDNPDRTGETPATQPDAESGGQVPVGDVRTPDTVVIKVTPGCDSEVNIVYEQRNTLARVEGSIASSSCPASRGEYTAVVSFTDLNGERTSLEFVEPWQRNDDLPISFLNDYEIGENVDLVSVRLRRLRCTCTETAAE
jgi:hypothetical protein